MGCKLLLSFFLVPDARRCGGDVRPLKVFIQQKKKKNFVFFADLSYFFLFHSLKLFTKPKKLFSLLFSSFLFIFSFFLQPVDSFHICLRSHPTRKTCNALTTIPVSRQMGLGRSGQRRIKRKRKSSFPTKNLSPIYIHWLVATATGSGSPRSTRLVTQLLSYHMQPNSC